MLPASSRLLRLLSLLQARGSWSGPELAARLEITERTVRRDVDRLRSLGYPVHATSGVAGGYRLGSGAKLPPLQLEEDEAVAVAIALRTAASGGVSGVEEPAVRAMAKLEQVLPSRLRRRVNAVGAAIVPLPAAGPSVDARVLSTVAAACRERERLRFTYGDRLARSSEREIEPHGLVHAGTRWYLVAWDLGREDWRTFRLDRITGRVAAVGRFVPRPLPDRDLATYVSRSVSTNAYPTRARLILHAPAEIIRAKVPASAAHVEAVDEARCVLDAGASSLDVVLGWITMLGVDFEPLAPPELTERVRALAERFDRAGAGPLRPAPARAARARGRERRGAAP